MHHKPGFAIQQCGDSRYRCKEIEISEGRADSAERVQPRARSASLVVEAGTSKACDISASLQGVLPLDEFYEPQTVQLPVKSEGVRIRGRGLLCSTCWSRLGVDVAQTPVIADYVTIGLPI
ncbi:hypothetical protein WOLCODRAFT_23170 [Wolfiporia cocos MD-104 SS10]|uniref:Uncharacterized protein n=1 Tax=Wolfiporia cocos (strain MD-104) TaxID=742152 RepID=A0A2H3JNK5_WOLCO|nr:hypothetical protein WOLCODRAFT_23170 [Wolfiporia cocos MD-104 SS10]